MPLYMPERWQRHHWQTEQRYYIAEVTQDLFGQWLLRRSWGSHHSARGNEQRLPAASYEEALRLLQATARRRNTRGYRPLSSCQITAGTEPALTAKLSQVFTAKVIHSWW